MADFGNDGVINEYAAFEDGNGADPAAPPCNIIIFGATGDLTNRKLIPALFSLHCQGSLAPQARIVAFARRDLTDDLIREKMRKSVEDFAKDLWRDEAKRWPEFAQRIVYHRSDYDSPDGYNELKNRLDAFDTEFGTNGNRLYYLATPPQTYSQVVFQLRKARLNEQLSPDASKRNFSRIIIEKPFGQDLASARALNAEVRNSFREAQVYRIDHYLGKETVQNIFVFRFANAVFEPIWNQNFIDSVQITVAETVGVESRAGYFDQAGELRDMVQSHALQILTLVAMEPPVSLEANAIRDEKVKVLRSLRQMKAAEIAARTIRAQYVAGLAEGKAVPGYLQENGVSPQSLTETYVAMRCSVENWRWAGVPFFIRAGKRLPKRVTEINIVFKNIPEILLARMSYKGVEPNVLTVRIQPDEGISMRLGTKPPGLKMRVVPVDLDFTYGASFGQRMHDAYERLLLDAMNGDASLFTRDDEVEAEWAFATPIIEAWRDPEVSPIQTYMAGSWGPESASLLIRDSNPRRRWLDR
ncbi:MAG: glucose-6-phosphate dehydrogenase [Capsulimonadaceae bacterium]|nr:glucose-6-phosphate dehydrogenase [Capsulimonadaceae bacterium]